MVEETGEQRKPPTCTLLDLARLEVGCLAKKKVTYIILQIFSHKNEFNNGVVVAVIVW
jgi:hypothetical protein